MNIEIEIKFLDVDFDKIREKLRREKANFLKKFFEENIVFDTKDLELKNKNMVLRLRRADKITICLKKPIKNMVPSKFKELEEYEVETNNFEIAKKIFNNLGFLDAFKYEKIREVWKLSNCYIFLDELPFGKFVELEGEKEAIDEVIDILDLKRYPSSNKNYYQLFLESSKKDKSLVFPESFKSRFLEGGKNS